MCQNGLQASHIGSRECVSIMSESFAYSRKKQQGKSFTLSYTDAPAITKRSGEDCLSIISSDAPSVAVRELHVASQTEHDNEIPLMPSIAVNMEPAGLKSKFISRCSPVKELGSESDSISKYGGKRIVYRRKNPRGRDTGVSSPEAPCLSGVSSDSPSNGDKELHVASQRGNHVPEEQESNEPSKSTREKMIEVDSIIASCSSSSKSDAELVSAFMQTEVDDSVECSSSSATAAECLNEGMSEKDICISILRSQGVLRGISPSRNYASAEVVGDSSGSSSTRLCKICSHLESTRKMLICDNCEDAFHLFCCNPRVKEIPFDEWSCHSCSKKGGKILKEAISTSSYVIGEKGGCTSSIDESNPIVLMLRDTEPYSSGVRCGKGFQAEVPEWSGPITNDIDEIPEPLEMNPSDLVRSTELNFSKRSMLSSIGNWLQCRKVVDGAGESDNETICGKWRRAPLFEVQTDNWECFCCVRWNPIHADCVTPQEQETDEVLKQLKYIQMLRPQLDAKRRKSEHRREDNDSMEG